MASPDKGGSAALAAVAKVKDSNDLSAIRGAASPDGKARKASSQKDLDGLAELLPDLKSRRRSAEEAAIEDHVSPSNEQAEKPLDDGAGVAGHGAAENVSEADSTKMSIHSVTELINHTESLQVQESREVSDSYGKNGPSFLGETKENDDEYSDQMIDDGDSLDDYPGSDEALEESEDKIPKEFMNISSGASIGTATQTHEMRMPMSLPTFKPATGCTNASDFVVRCFVARLRSGITVVKHGRSRWCKSRLRVLHIHPDGRSLSWKPAEGEPTSSKRPPKLDLSACLEVRHAWSADPQNPMYTGTPILRQKCEAANAHKSFALIFKQRTVDITATTADQCKVLMEGFSALCFRLHVASMAGKKGQGRPMPEEDGISTTASATLTNTSNPKPR